MRNTATVVEHTPAPGEDAERDWGRGDAPDVPSILDVDREYRKAVANGKVEVRHGSRLDSSSRTALPVLRTRRRGWSFTAAFSVTPACRAMHRDHDWVAVDFDDGSGRRGRVTVVTAMRSPVRGRRVVRAAEGVSIGGGAA